ncbi:MAG TPA: amino acid ABC transporter permease [Methanocorpusculum sp.]|nr:amino acid ABC transporter permease [Methanocorpusculum sp.]
MFESFSSSAAYFASGTLVTLELVALALLIGFVFGMILTIGQVYGPKPVRAVVAAYVWFFRGLPNLILLFLFYFIFIPTAPVFVVAVVVLGMRSAAYQSQIFRGVIQGISAGQMEAALSLGMTKIQAVLTIIIPQALRLALPSWANEYPVLLTDSAIASAIGVTELLTSVQHRVAATGDALALYLGCAVIFILLNYGGMLLLQKIEERVRIPGFGNSEGEQL